MKQVTRILLPSLLCLCLWQQASLAKTTKRASTSGSSPAGVVLQTPNPQTALEHNNRGVELGSKGLWPDAIKEHEIALSMEPGNKDFRTNLSSAQLHYGNVLYHSGKYYEATKQYRGALFVDPDNMPADEGLDECFKRMGKDPNDIGFRKGIAEDLEVKGLFEDAIVEYRKVVKMDDAGNSHADLGYVLLKADKPVDGYQELCIAVEKPWPNDEVIELSQCHRKLAEILTDYAYRAKDSGRGTVGMKRLINAVTEYRRAVTLNPADAEAIRGFVETVRQCTAMKPSFDNTLMLGGAYLLEHDFYHAKMAYEQCYRIDKTRPELIKARMAYHKGVATWPTAPDELVMESLNKVQAFLQNDPDNATWYYILGRLKQHLHDNDGALEAYSRAQKINYLVDPDLMMQIKVLSGETASAAAGGGQSKAPGGQSPAAIAAAGGTGGATVKEARPDLAASAAASSATQPASGKRALDPRNLATYALVEEKMASNPKEALTIVDDLLSKTPTDGHAWMLKGDLQLKTGDQDGAAASFRTAAGFKEPEAEDALDNLNTIRVQPNLQQADQLMQAKDFVHALNQLEDAAVKAPGLPAIHHKMADVLAQMNDAKGAAREERKAKELESKK